MTPQKVPNLLPIIGRQVKRYRREAAMSQLDLAEKTGFFRTYLSRIENGMANPSIIVLATIAHALNVDVQSLLTEPQALKCEAAT